ncbi:MAG: nuclear transport factor 2 family protein [Scytolyngbya sp. HA4215-MV1]|jgi:steroid delta-isomerase|nr:nuclear transport factor 2 family protein [Scytolyngbya sp. HA4215-MV1]
MASTEALETVIKTYFSATRHLDVDTWLDTFAEDAVSYDPVGSTPLCTSDEKRQMFEGIADLFERVGFAEDFVAIAGNEAAVKWTGRGIAKDGREIVFEGIDVFIINDAGKIQTLYRYWNPNALLVSLETK